MKESVGLSFIIGFIATFFGIFIVMFTGSLAYSKAFKAKNNIINIIEEHGGYTTIGDAATDINTKLKEIGYRVDSSSKNSCPTDYGTNLVAGGSYHYCVYKVDQDNRGGSYYKVITYMYFDFPIIGSHVEFPVSGETRVLGIWD